ncbi:MAG TPA: hypothetical protein VFI22_08185 [Thermomicrobiales bacterium]|nr:hypothetical protein [Thermomicrobiales bacterium]
MRRRPLLLVFVSILLGAAAVGGRHVVAAQGPAFANHPAVGSWRVHREPENPQYPVELMILSADGAVLDFGAFSGATGVGRWEPMGADAATVTFTVVSDGPAYIVVRSSVRFAPDGQSFTGAYTEEIVFDPDHAGTSGQIGPGTVDGTRMAAEAPGTPVASFEQFFPQPAGTPEATPDATPVQ